MKLTVLFAITYIISCLATTTVWEITFQGKPSAKSRFYVLNNWDKEGGAYNKVGSTPFPADKVSDIMLKTMGILRDGAKWTGVQFGNLFRRPRATALFLINGLSELVEFTSLSDQSYAVDQTGLTGIASNDQLVMFNSDNVMSHFQKLFDGQSLSITNGYVEDNDEDVQEFDFLPKGVFNLKCSIDRKFVKELQAIKASVQELSTSSVKDPAPDTFLFTFNSLSALQVKYSHNSPQMAAALKLVHETIQQVSKKLNELYDNDIVIQALVLQWKYSKMSEEEIVGVKTILGIYFTKGQIEEITVNFPILKLPEMSDETKATLCDGLSYYIDNENGKLESNCPTSSTDRRRLRRDLEDYEGISSSNSSFVYGDLRGVTEDRSDNFSAMFLIIFVTVVPLILSLFAISWGMWNMDPGRDSVIYRNTDPVGIKLE